MSSSGPANHIRRFVHHRRVLACLATLPLAAGAALAQGEPPLDEPDGIAVEAAGQLLVVDLASRALLCVDPVTGQRTVVSDSTRGGGPPFELPHDVAAEPAGTIVVADPGLQALLRVDPETGDRVILSDADTGTGPPLAEPMGLAVEDNGSLVVADRTLAAILRVDPVTGDRVVVSDATTGGGPLLERPRAIAIEADGSLLVGDQREEEVPATLYRVDPLTGDRTTVSGKTRGNGVSFLTSNNLAVLPDGRAVVVDASPPRQLVAVDPVTGNRDRLSGHGAGGGPQFVDPRAVTATASDLMVAEAGLDAVVRVDPEDGSRYVLGAGLSGAATGRLVTSVACGNETTGEKLREQTSEESWDCEELGLVVSPGDVVFTGAAGTVQKPGDGPPFASPQGIAVEADGHILVLDDGVVRVDPVSGDRVIVSDDETGTGPPFDRPEDVAVENDGSIVVTEPGIEAILRVDPVTGDRTIVSDIDHGDGLELSNPMGIQVDSDGSLLVADAAIPGVFRVDPMTGDRTIVTGRAVGTGPEFVTPWGLEIEADGSLLVVDEFVAALFRVDIATGDRTFVTEFLLRPQGLAIEATAHALIVENSQGTVVRVNTATGETKVVSGPGVGTGPEFDEASWIAVEGDGQILVTDLDNLFRVDPVTGDRTIFSGEPTEFVTGSIAGVEFPVEAVCQDLTTGDVARGFVYAGTSWSCEFDLGLEMFNGHEVFTGARGVR